MTGDKRCSTSEDVEEMNAFGESAWVVSARSKDLLSDINIGNIVNKQKFEQLGRNLRLAWGCHNNN